MAAKIHPNFRAATVLEDESARILVPGLREHGCFLIPTGGDTFAAGTPDRWTAPNGVIVVVMRRGRVNHFHTIWGSGEPVQVPAGWDPYTLAYCVHRRHLGPCRRALRAFARLFVIDQCAQAFHLRRFVREGD